MEKFPNLRIVSSSVISEIALRDTMLHPLGIIRALWRGMLTRRGFALTVNHDWIKQQHALLLKTNFYEFYTMLMMPKVVAKLSGEDATIETETVAWEDAREYLNAYFLFSPLASCLSWDMVLNNRFNVRWVPNHLFELNLSQELPSRLLSEEEERRYVLDHFIAFLAIYFIPELGTTAGTYTCSVGAMKIFVNYGTNNEYRICRQDDI